MAIKTVRALDAGSNLHSESAFSLNALATDILGSGGVIGAIAATSGIAPCTGAYAVNAQSTPNMSVRVTNGVLWMTGTPSGGTSQAVRVDMDAFEDVSIASNSSGSTKYDWLYMVLDAAKMANPAADASDVATLVVSRSTSNTVDNGTPPTYGLVLAVITVANGAASITNANIADARVRAGVNSLLQSAQGIVSGTNLTTSAIKLGYAEASASQAGISAVTDLTNLSVNVVVPPGGRGIRIHGHIHAEGSAANLIKLQIREGSTMLNATRIPNQSTTGGWGTPLDVFYIGTPSAGAHTYKLSLSVESGGGTVTMAADAAVSYGLAFILVEAI